MTDHEQYVEYMKHLHSLEVADERTTLAIGPFSAITLIGALQLAMRHPELSAFQRDILTQFIDQMRPMFAGTPGEHIINQGNDPAFDQ